jgi:hypothetical protein
MTPEERNLFQDGYSSGLVERIERMPDRRNVINNINNSPAARREIETALGPQRANELEARLRIDGVMDLARGAVQGNSTTARQLAEIGLAGGAYGLTAGSLTSPDPTAALTAALTYGLARGRGAINANVARQVAEMLASNDVNRLRTGMRIIAGNPAMMGALRNFDQAAAKTAAVQLTPAGQPGQAQAAPAPPQQPAQTDAPVAPFDPASIGARKAADGNHYVPDPNRPGKYLRVVVH